MVDIVKNHREIIRVNCQDYRGHQLINVRVWYDGGAGEYLPGRQGLALKVELLPEIIAALSALLDEQEAAI